jgi:hypothetical protein
MSLASELRAKVKQEESRTNKEAGLYEKERKKRISAAVPLMVQELLPEIVKAINQRAKEGKLSYDVESYEYYYSDRSEKDFIKVLAHKKIMELLKKKPYKFGVKENEKKDGYNGEGNYYSDFYHIYSWTISWE